MRHLPKIAKKTPPKSQKKSPKIARMFLYFKNVKRANQKRTYMKLYEISNEIEAILDQVNPETGEIGELLEQQLNALEMEKGRKALNLAKYMKSIDADINALKAEEKALGERRKRLETKYAGLEKYLALNIKGEKYQDAQASISWRPSQGVKYVGVVPDEWMKIKKEPDTSRIKEQLKAGVVIEGAILEDRLNLNIK